MVSDVRFALRLLRRSPGFVVATVLTLALGIGGTTAMFSIVNGVLLRPLSYPREREILLIESRADGGSGHLLAPADFLDLARDNHTFRTLAAYREGPSLLRTSTGENVRLHGAVVTADFFNVFGLPPAAGHTFIADSKRESREPVMIVSYDVWQRHLGGTANVVGRAVRVDDQFRRVVGVMSPAFDWPRGADVWLLSPLPVPPPPIALAGDLLTNREMQYFRAVGRVSPNITVSQAQSDLSAVMSAVAARYPGQRARGVKVFPLREEIVGDVRPALLGLLGAVGVVLLIACANVSGLLLARAPGRVREISVREALGASPSRIFRQLLMEGLIVGAIGGLAGLGLGVWVLDLLLAIVPTSLPRLHDIRFDGHVAAWTALVTIATGLLFGLVPALQVRRVDVVKALKEGGARASDGRGRSRPRQVLVVGQIALTFVLLVSAGLLVSSLVRLRSVDPGYRADLVSFVPLPIPPARYPGAAAQAAFYSQVLERVTAHPSVISAAIGFPGPLHGNSAAADVEIDGWPARSTRERPFINLSSVSPSFFATMGIGLLKGRTFSQHDDERGAPVAVINAAAARRLWPSGNALNQRVRFREGTEEWVTIIGIVGDMRSVGLAAPAPATLYLPYVQFPVPFMGLFVRARTVEAETAPAIRSAIREVDPALPIGQILRIDRMLVNSIGQPRFRAVLVAAFAVAGLLLGIVGLYGLISYRVCERAKEIAIRIALGATRRQILSSVMREGLLVTALGIVVGVAGSLATSRVIGSFLFGVTATDPTMFLAVAALFVLVAAVATLLPARRAINATPLQALRTE